MKMRPANDKGLAVCTKCSFTSKDVSKLELFLKATVAGIGLAVHIILKSRWVIGRNTSLIPPSAQQNFKDECCDSWFLKYQKIPVFKNFISTWRLFLEASASTSAVAHWRMNSPNVPRLEVINEKADHQQHLKSCRYSFASDPTSQVWLSSSS